MRYDVIEIVPASKLPTAKANAPDVLELEGQGIGRVEIARRLDIGRSSVYRILEDRKQD